MISEEKLQAWEQLVNQATDGPWCICEGDVCRHDCPSGDPENCPYQCEECLITDHEDKLFICAARDAMPELIAEVRRYRLLQQTFKEYQKTFASTCENLVQTRREADWLAFELTKHVAKYLKCYGCEHYGIDLIHCRNCWREAARNAVHEA